MKPHKTHLLAPLLAFFIASYACAQELPPASFRNPMDFDIALSATFAEFRTNHFHAGIDLRTGGTTGKPVYAVADGYVHMVRISPWGGGKMLYINHSNGYQSVYMHLDAFEGETARRVLLEQYQQQSYAIVKEFPEGLIRVSKGQLIARSGNSGSSGGPHLHFELRRNGLTINPLLLGLPYRDNIKPIIRGIRIYPTNGQPIDASKTDTLSVAGPFYLGIYATDAAEGSTQKNGIDRIEIHLDGKLFFKYTTTAFPLDSSRMINALIDYPLFLKSRHPYLLTRALPGAEGPWIPFRHGDGILRLQPGTTHRIDIKAYDIKNNTTSRTLIVTAHPAPPAPPPVTTGTSVSYDQPFEITQHTFHISLPPYSLYADDHLSFSFQNDPRFLSPILSLELTQNPLPPDKWYTLQLHATYHTPEKAIIVRLEGSKLIAYPTKHSNGAYSAQVRDFGRFALANDTSAPIVLPLNFSNNKRIKTTTLRIKISDNLSGINTYRCLLNGNWILAEYDGKTASLTIDAAPALRTGTNLLQLEVCDGCSNRTVTQWTIIK